MSRARREKKSKANWKIWVPIICVIVVGVTFYMIYDIQNKIEKMDPSDNRNAKENTVVNESVEQNDVIEENVIENNVENEIHNETDNTASNSSNTTNTANQSSAPAKPAVTDEKQKAIELVKEKWGKDDTVNYVFDYVNENGEYVIAVKDRASATVKYYFRVNLETESVELD